MSDPIAVCNQALGELGESFIYSFADDTSISTLCATLYPDTRDEVLELHPWNFCSFQARLARSPDTPVMTWKYQYVLPTNPWCIRVRGTDQGNGAKFEIAMNAQGQRVLYSNEAAVSVAYTGRVEDLGIWSPLALQVLVKVLASRLAKARTGQNSTAQLKYQEALTLLPQAQSSDGREGYPVVLRANHTLTVARHRRGGSLSHRNWVFQE